MSILRCQTIWEMLSQVSTSYFHRRTLVVVTVSLTSLFFSLKPAVVYSFILFIQYDIVECLNSVRASLVLTNTSSSAYVFCFLPVDMRTQTFKPGALHISLPFSCYQFQSLLWVNKSESVPIILTRNTQVPSLCDNIPIKNACCCFLVYAGILLQEEKINSVFLLYLMSIPSFCILAVAALALENWALLESPLHYDRHLWVFILLSCLGSVMYNLASCCVITLTSAVTLHILGNLSVVGNLLLSQLLFGSELSALSCAGAVLTLSGMLIYQNSEFIVSYLDARRAKSKGSESVDFHNACGEDLNKASMSEPTYHQQRTDGKQEDKIDWTERMKKGINVKG